MREWIRRTSLWSWTYRIRQRRQLSFTSIRDASTLAHSASQTDLRPQSVVFSGIQPTGVPHLGNYLGALRTWVQLQKDAPASTRLIFSIVDLHALTTHPSPQLLRQWRREAFASLLAVGLDPERCIVFFQSEVSAHAELMWTLSTNASFGYLSRMTQWKSKLSLSDSASVAEADVRAKLQLGLFSYPVLQAADVLVHGASHVPVGQDQKQHVEFARECAQSFNHVYGTGLTVPEVLISSAQRIMSLTDPTSKMSKSTGAEKSRLLLSDAPLEIATKVRQALTDSQPGITYDPIRRRGVANLIEIVAHLEGIKPEEVVANYNVDTSLRAFKEDVARRINAQLEPIRDRLHSLLQPKNNTYLDEIAARGRAQARKSSAPVLARVYEKMGLGSHT